jgi:hypothetical protein
LSGGPIGSGRSGHSYGKRQFNGKIGANLLIPALAAVEPGEEFGEPDHGMRSGQVSVHRERMFALGDAFRGTMV